jgi:NTE family protein
MITPLRRTWPVALAVTALLVTGCAHWPATPRLETAGGPGYRLAESSRKGQSDDLYVVLAISGGGMRAASLGYGALEELRRTEVTVGGQRRRLIDEIDVISAVSGGTLPATYYALRGEAAFGEFEAKVLSRDLEHEMLMKVLAPSAWFRLPSGTFNKSDLFAELYDETIFDRKTFADLKAAGGPFVFIHATDITTGARFSYTQDDFDAICGDLSPVPLARAIATSTALAPMLPPITLENRAATCGWSGPTWAKAVEAAETSRDTPGRPALRLRALRAYENPDRKYIHLFDGGISENLGLNEVILALDLLEVAPDAPELAALRRARKVVVIVVNAFRFTPKDWEKSEEPPGTDDLQDQMWSIPTDRISFDAVEKVNELLARWRAEGPADGPDRREAYLVNVTFDSLKDPGERAYFSSVKTSLTLPKEQVDRLREVSGRLLRESPAYRRLLEDLAAGR